MEGKRAQQLDRLKTKFLASYNNEAQRVKSETHSMVKNAQAVAQVHPSISRNTRDVSCT